MQPGHYQFFLIPQKNPYSNQATPKKYFRTQKNPEIKNFKPKKILQSSPSLEIPSTAPGVIRGTMRGMSLVQIAVAMGQMLKL